MVKLFTPELIPDRDLRHAFPAEMTSPNDATEDAQLFVEYADHKALEAHAKRMQAALVEIIAIADSIPASAERGDIFYAIGKIIGAARFHGEWIKVPS